jgi:hypothetical protein
MRLDIAGLTQEDSGNAPDGAQSAFWLVGGEYQSYETTNYQVELTLNVQRVFGRSKRVTLRGPFGDPIDKQIKDAIDGVMSEAAETIIPTRFSEARAQMVSGKSLLGLNPLDDTGFIVSSISWISDSELAERRRRNLEEAIRSFETVLLLEPTNREAKIYLSTCLRNETIQRIQEARSCYFEIIDDSVSDKWLEIAKKALLWSFAERATLMEPNPAVAAPWYEAAAMRATNATAVQYFQSLGKGFRAKLNLQNETDPAKKLETAFNNELSTITNEWYRGGRGDDVGIQDFVRTFGTNKAAAARQFVEWYPKFVELAPKESLEILTSVVTAQIDTNVSVVAEFKKRIDEIAAHPDRVSDPTNFWRHIWPVVLWSWQYKDYDLAENLLEGSLQFKVTHPNATWVSADEISQQKLALAFVYFREKKWDKALAIFEAYSNHPVRAGEEGPWGPLFTVFYPRDFAERCRENLGLPSKKDSNEFSMGKPALCFCMPSTFTLDDQGLWFGGERKLIHVDFELKTNDVIQLPLEDFEPVTAICIASSNIWIGTGGGGLIEYDKGSKKCRRFTTENGMMRDAVAALHLAGDTLWIGYGLRANEGGVIGEGGGLGKLELSSRHFVSFMSPMTTDFVKADKLDGTVLPTKSAIINIAGGEKDDVWMLTDGDVPAPQLFQYQSKENKWTAGDKGPAMDADAKYLVVGQYHTPSVSVQNLRDGNWRGLNASTNLPSGLLTTVTLEGDNVWVGGRGFVAQLDMAHDKMLHLAYLKEESVDRIQTGGGYVWAQCRWVLYRAPLPR